MEFEGNGNDNFLLLKSYDSCFRIFVLFLPWIFYFKVKALFIRILFGTILLLLFQHVFHLAPPQVSICNHLFVKEIFCLFMSVSKTLKKT